MHTVEQALMFWGNTCWPPSVIAHRPCTLLQHQQGVIAFLCMAAVLSTAYIFASPRQAASCLRTKWHDPEFCVCGVSAFSMLGCLQQRRMSTFQSCSLGSLLADGLLLLAHHTLYVLCLLALLCHLSADRLHVVTTSRVI